MQNLKDVFKLNALLIFTGFCLIFVFSAGNIQAQSNQVNNFSFTPFAKKQDVLPAQTSKIVDRRIGKDYSFSFKTLTPPPSYPLVVRGGRGLKLSTENTKTKSLVKLVVEFTFSARKAGDGLRSGYGAWQDRGGRAGEPARLEYFAQEDDARKIIDYLQSAGASYTFECYNTGKGYLQVTKAYTKKVRID